MILSKYTLVSNINNEISDNSTGQISPYDIRHNLLDIIDSVHNLTLANDLTSTNFSTPQTRTTRAGQNTIEKLGLDGYVSTDNSAFGYSALRSNYQGVQNTAIGSNALSCNVYGQDNAAIGYNALAGNTLGVGNVGLGNFSLNNNKLGNFNIAIGHSAGYYVDRSTNYQLFIASHPVDQEYICNNPIGSGLTPLVYGDLDNDHLRFGIAVNTLHNDGALQVGGSAAPSSNDLYDVGSYSYRWRYLYLSSGIFFPNNKSIKIDTNNNLNINATILPLDNVSYSIGSNDYKWLSGHFENIYVSGQAFLNSYTSITSCTYLCKTLYLAASGECTEENDCSYLSDSQVENAGFILKSTSRDYEFLFKPSGSISCAEEDNIYSFSSWNTNISLHVASGCHVKTDRIISNKNNVSIANSHNCYGLFIKDRNVYIANEEILSPDPAGPSGINAGVGNLNVIAEDGASDDYIISYLAPNSGVNISQRFLSATKFREIDTFNSNKDKLAGFELKYYDDSEMSYEGPLSDRFVINSYDQTSEAVNSIVLLKNSDGGGIFGLSSFDGASDYALPATTFNIRNKSDAVVRVTAENEGSVYSAIQLLGGTNCLENGLEILYMNTSGYADINMYKMSGVTPFFRLEDTNKIGIFATFSGIMNDMLTIGDELNTEAVISLHHSSGVPSGIANYSKLYIQDNIDTNQSSSLYFMDSSGNIFDLIYNKYDTYDGLLYTDDNGNTLGGIYCSDNRDDIQDAHNNTAIGYHTLALLSSGTNNTILGAYAASGIEDGSCNTVLGYKSLVNSSGHINHNIIIGTSGIGEGLNTDYNFLLGSTNSNILLHGILGPENNDKKLTLPSGGKLELHNADNTEYLALNYNTIELVDTNGSDCPDGNLSINFTGNETKTVLNINCDGAELNGNLNLTGSLIFNDTTVLNSSSFLDEINILSNYKNTFIIEGIASSSLNPAANINTPSSGTMTLRGTSTTKTLINRDRLLSASVGDYIIAILIGDEYRPLWVSSAATNCQCCN